MSRDVHEHQVVIQSEKIFNNKSIVEKKFINLKYYPFKSFIASSGRPTSESLP